MGHWALPKKTLNVWSFHLSIAVYNYKKKIEKKKKKKKKTKFPKIFEYSNSLAPKPTDGGVNVYKPKKKLPIEKRETRRNKINRGEGGGGTETDGTDHAML